MFDSITPLLTLALGLSAQLLFSARIVLQWVQSERARQVLVPTLFWQVSLVSALLMLLYGMLRHDPVIIVAQLISYGIYVRNLHLGGEWGRWPLAVRALALALPVGLVAAFLANTPGVSLRATLDSRIPAWLLALGTAGQGLLLLRFVYQWAYSERRRQSLLPLGFWLVSVGGAVLLLAYAVLRRDLALGLGNAFGLVTYSRNLWLLRQVSGEMVK